MKPNESDAEVVSETGYSKGYLRYALGMFLLIYIVNFVDRQIFSILIEPIKQEIDLSDTQLGLLGRDCVCLILYHRGDPHCALGRCRRS